MLGVRAMLGCILPDQSDAVRRDACGWQDAGQGRWHAHTSLQHPGHAYRGLYCSGMVFALFGLGCFAPHLLSSLSPACNPKLASTV